jgi:hypothetical protein
MLYLFLQLLCGRRRQQYFDLDDGGCYCFCGVIWKSRHQRKTEPAAEPRVTNATLPPMAFITTSCGQVEPVQNPLLSALAGRPHRLASKRRFRRLPNKPHINKWFPCALCVDPSITSSGNFTFSGDEEHQSSLFKITFSALWVSRK